VDVLFSGFHSGYRYKYMKICCIVLRYFANLENRG